MNIAWSPRRLTAMSPREVAHRTATAVEIRRWRHADTAAVPHTVHLPRFTAPPPADWWEAAPADAVDALLAAADRLMAGRAEFFGVERTDFANPDWHHDPRTGRNAPVTYAFDIPYRDEDAVGDIKQIWEPSRHQHLTVLAAAYAITGDERYATRVARHLRSWWAANPPLRGVHWVSGIELGIRLISWVWTRRLLHAWPAASRLFEDNPEFRRQLYWHQRWLATFSSHGSSANNHVIAEAAGQLSAACAFGWFAESPRWRVSALRTLDTELRNNTFPSGINRELATEYHALVLELGLAAVVEAECAGVTVPGSTHDVLIRMTDAVAAMLDDTGRPPRQGDADDGHGLIIDGPGTDRWASLLATGDALFGRLPWWPKPPGGDVRSSVLAALARPWRTAGPVRTGGAAESPGVGLHPATRPSARPATRPDHFPDAGMTLLRTTNHGELGEIWCRCDGGPHGFLSIAAHAHADALSIEVRHDGVDVLADPGTYCYHGRPAWRSYFRSTLGHNTVQLNGTDQSVSGGPFLWTRHARSSVLVADPEHGFWQAAHDGYAYGEHPAVHKRTVHLSEACRQLRVVDEICGFALRRCTIAFHLGPLITAELIGDTAWLSWPHRRIPGACHTAVLALPPGLHWSAHRGETDPPLGWYSAGFGTRVPATTLLGVGRARGHTTFTTLLRFTS
uniref:Heparinase n=1 Tax=Thermocrispum agreste TaxID=37925 RepID=A0A2W4JT68_9PSEU|nr:MAG: heparinase [Thermocrispum agreste]